MTYKWTGVGQRGSHVMSVQFRVIFIKVFPHVMELDTLLESADSLFDLVVTLGWSERRNVVSGKG